MESKARFVLSKKAMLSQYEQVASLCDVVAYSAKTNYVVSSLMEELTPCDFCIHSLVSVDKVKDKSRIWYLPQAWDEKELAALFDVGVRKFVVDNEQDLEVLEKFLQGKDVEIELLLRMRLKEHTIHTGKYFVYGMYSKQINTLIPKLKANSKIVSLGVHFHRKSQNISEWSLVDELKELLSEETLSAIDYVDIGGGIPVQYKNFRADVLKHVFAEIVLLRDWLHSLKIKLIIEPGRFIAAPAAKLVATVRNVYDGNIIVDCSVYNTALDTFVIHHKLMVESELPEHEGTMYVVKGMTPCSMDIYRYRVWLPEVKAGDELVFLNAGAYNYASDFCNLQPLRTEVVE